MTALLIIVGLTIFVSFNCSLFEAALYSTRSVTLEAEKNSPRTGALAGRLLEMKKKISAPIAAIVILDTVVDTVGATMAGVYASDVLGAGHLAIFSVVFTLLVVFIGEIAPKTIGAVYWRQVWPAIVWPITVMKYALYPLIVLTQKFSNLLTAGHKVPQVTEEEILTMVRIGATEGEITHGESMLVHNIITLENKPVKEIMTPRTVLFSLDCEMTVEQAIKAVDRKGFTRIPIYSDHPENIIGYIIIHELFSAKTLSRPETKLRSMANPMSFVPETRDCLALLTRFLKHRQHISVVVDEYGGVSGLVTLEDLIETVLGDEIVDETDRVVDLQERARQLKPQRPTE